MIVLAVVISTTACYCYYIYYHHLHHPSIGWGWGCHRTKNSFWSHFVSTWRLARLTIPKPSHLNSYLCHLNRKTVKVNFGRLWSMWHRGCKLAATFLHEGSFCPWGDVGTGCPSIGGWLLKRIVYSHQSPPIDELAYASIGRWSVMIVVYIMYIRYPCLLLWLVKTRLRINIHKFSAVRGWFRSGNGLPTRKSMSCLRRLIKVGDFTPTPSSAPGSRKTDDHPRILHQHSPILNPPATPSTIAKPFVWASGFVGIVDARKVYTDI